MIRSIFAYPGDDLITAASLSASSEDPDYPIENVQTFDPQVPYQAAGLSTTITVSHPSSARAAVAFINHNLIGATVTVGGVSVTIPARDAGGQCVHAWGLLGLGAATSTSIVITGAASAVKIGRICLVSALQELPWLYGVEFETMRPVSRIPTTYGGRLQYDKGVRVRRARGRVLRETFRATWETLTANAKGAIVPFLLVPDRDVNDAWYTQIEPDAVSVARNAPMSAEMPIELIEAASGLPL